MFFYIHDGSGNLIQRTVTLYKVSGGQLIEIASGMSKGQLGQSNSNGACDIENNDASTQYPSQTIWDPLYNFEASDYVITCEGYYIRLFIGLNWDIYIYYNSGTGFTDVSGNRPFTVEHSGTNTNYSLSFDNNFEDGLSGGKVYFDQVEQNAPYTPTLAAWSWNHSAEAKTPQTAGSYTRKFYQWEKNYAYLDTAVVLSSIAKESASYTARFHKYYDVVVENQLPGYSNQGTITVAGSTRNSPYTYEVLPGQQFTAAGITQAIDQVTFTFSYWKKDGQTTSETSPFTPTANSTYSAYYTAKPSSWNRAIQCTSAVGQNVVITWNDHPSTGVTYYEIWRKIPYGSATYLGTVNRGVRSFTDPDYLRSNNPADDLLQYDIRPYYNPSSTLGDPEFSNVTYGALYSIQQLNEGSAASAVMENQSNNGYSLSNFPNPFNPSTIISYQLPERNFVNISIFNSLGEKVCELVNGIREQGTYQTNFNASNLASGIYFYSLKTDTKLIVKKMLLVK